MSTKQILSAFGVPPERAFARRGRTIVAAIVICMGLVFGCTRAHYRTQADSAVTSAVANGTANPRFQIPDYNIAVDSRSRLFDPTDADRPPMPPDDPDSHRLMECVDGHRGWPYWHKDGDLPDVEVNDYQSWLPIDDEGKIRVNLRGALDLARLHSREYQSQLETLYLSALDVTFERFRFDAQFFGGNSTQYTGIGKILNGGASSSTLATTTNLQLRKLFTTGGSLVVGAANSIVWQFSGHETSVNSSLLNFAFSQPLLQFAGRPVVLERLTRVERNMLSNIRQFHRYRQGFYLSVATGTGGSGGLQRAGGLFGGSGLSGFTGVGTGGFGGVGAIGVVSSGAFAGGQGTGAANANGFIGFLQQRQTLRNFRARNVSLRNAWMQLNAAFDAGRAESRFQVDFARQSYYSGQSQLMNQAAIYESILDGYKMQLGLPPNVPLEIRDPFFDQFDLINTELTQFQDDVADRMEVLSTALVSETNAAADTSLEEVPQRIEKYMEEFEHDLEVMGQNLPSRRKSLQTLSSYPEVIENQFDVRALSPDSLDRQIKLLHSDGERVLTDLKLLASQARELLLEPDLELVEHLRAEKEILNRLSASLLELSLLQARARLHAITLVPVNVAPETAFQVALMRRPDWMNAKAGLVDTWRLIRYNANALRSNVTINVSGDLNTSGNSPVKFQSMNGDLRAGIQIDPPLTRVLERNQFRQSLIDYQQARRSLMAQRDEIHRSLRADLRQIRLDQFNLELRRLAVDVAITQTDVARLKLIEPEKPVSDGKTAAISPTVARDLVDALTYLQSTQFDLITVWGDYEVRRRQLDYDLGTMELDERGMWTDPGPLTDEMLLTRYYEFCSDPLSAPQESQSSGYVELGPGDLPPEPSKLDFPAL